MTSFTKSILIIGGGGREHCLAWKLSQSSLLSPSSSIFLSPGNGATATPVKPSVTGCPGAAILNVIIAGKGAEFIKNVVTWCVTQGNIGLVVVGPEDPLADGVVDALQSVNIPCFGPTQAAAQLEASKVYAKEFMTEFNIPTAKFESFTQLDAALAHLTKYQSTDRFVVKASGLAAGKGVLMCETRAKAEQAVSSMLGPASEFGAASQSIVIEDWIEGPEVSVLVFCDGKRGLTMPIAQDHKRRYEFDQGLNTGGMGTFAPSPLVDAELEKRIYDTIIQPALDGCIARGHPFKGVMFAGLMLTKDGPMTLEYNVRFGDPETQVVLPLLESDLLEIILHCVNGTMPQDYSIQRKANANAACVVAVSGGYPAKQMSLHHEITGLDMVVFSETNQAIVFQAGTQRRKEDGKIVNTGGRVLAVTGIAHSITEAFNVAYSNLDHIKFEGMGFRRDLGQSWYNTPRANNKLRLAVLGSTNGTDLPPLLSAIDTGKLNAEVMCVISNKGHAKILEKAQAHGIPVHTVTGKGEARDQLILDHLNTYGVDVVVLIGYMCIVTDVLLAPYANRIINVHPSLLPAFGGAANGDVHEMVLAAKIPETGCTVHLVTDVVDGGAILSQKRCKVEANDTVETLKKRVQSLEPIALMEAIQMYDINKNFLKSISAGVQVASPHLITFYRTPAYSTSHTAQMLIKLNTLLKEAGESTQITSIDTEHSFYVDFASGVTWTTLSDKQRKTLEWLLAETFEPELLARESFLKNESVIEVGPRLSFTSAWSTNACSICQNSNVDVRKMERFRRFGFTSDSPLSAKALTLLGNNLHDRMTEQVLTEPLHTFETTQTPEPWYFVELLEKGRDELARVNVDLGLALDDWDQGFIYDMFVKTLQRNPTSVELFDISQSNSEHSRHWFFRGDMEIDGEMKPKSLFQLVKDTLSNQKHNSVIAFADNSSAIEGFTARILEPSTVGKPASFTYHEKLRHLLLTAETHNFPSGVAPFPGAETGTGGRIRDTAATGRGSLVSAGISAYCVGQLHIPGYELPWENSEWKYPSNLAHPLKIAIEASNGASDYGNKFGEPVVGGFARSYGIRTPSGERREWIKPIMFSAGVGFIDEFQRFKGVPEKGMVVVKIGGPAYRIGMGGSAASSMFGGENKEALDFNAVQRGDAEMEQKVYRVIRACCEMNDQNPIVSIHDQGAGGNCNVLKEIVDPAGGDFDIRQVQVGDQTLSVLEIWGAEYQENWALLIREEHQSLFDQICTRERAPVCYVGHVSGNGVVTVWDSAAPEGSKPPVELDLKTVLGEIPNKTFKMQRVTPVLESLVLPADVTFESALDRVLRLMSVGSKRWLTNKVDRSVTGLVAQQQCVGPLQLPLANCSVIATSYEGITGVATAVGEQPVKGLLSPQAMARLTVGEALTNMVFADVSQINDIKCSGNWMWAAKLHGEGAALYDACEAMRQVMLETGIAVDGGKDSLSMAARTTEGETVKAPPALVVTLYAPCVDITHTLTPDIKSAGESTLIHIDFSGRSSSQTPRLGGSSLATVFGQLGDVTPDMDSSAAFVSAWNAVQSLIKAQLVLSGHDVSDGGIAVTVLEMSFAGNCGVDVNLGSVGSWAEIAFAEELGVVLEVHNSKFDAVQAALTGANITFTKLGNTVATHELTIKCGETTVLNGDSRKWRDVWEATSFELEKLQCDPACVESEQKTLSSRTGPNYQLTFQVNDTSAEVLNAALSSKPKVAIIREEGSNGDREMASAFMSAGFDAWDVSMTDLLTGRIHLNAGSADDGRPFRGVAFVGGFSYGDVLDSAKGWAGAILRNDSLWAQFSHFYARPDTFSLGVCNGCQLMALLGWVPMDSAKVNHSSPPARFIHNASGRYESRWTTVKIQESPSIFLQGMKDAVLGIWVSHGEGRAHFPSDSLTLQQVEEQNLAPIRYVDDNNQVTEQYPFNANGSPAGIAALTSANGRHLALMPHPERCARSWAMPYFPHSSATSASSKAWNSQYTETASHFSPWMKVFQNAREWCDSHPAQMLYGANIEKELYENAIRARVSSILDETRLTVGADTKKVGKVRDTYRVKLSEVSDDSTNQSVNPAHFPALASPLTDDEVMVLITTDRLSAFDRMIACIPCKGSVLNRVSGWWFHETKDIIENHVISTPHPNVTIGRMCRPFPIEFVVRRYMTGSTSTSLWTHYAAGSRNYCGHDLPDGLVKNQRLQSSLLTPTTKSDEHDRPISAAEILAENWMSEEHWNAASAAVLQLFERGEKLAASHGLILVDTKYELGLTSDGRVILIDEIHTPDSSRYWIACSYEQRMAAKQEPEMIDKEFLRIWYTQHCDPYADAALPVAPLTLVTELSRRYILLYEMITGGRYEFPAQGGDDEASYEAINKATLKALKHIKKAIKQ